MGRTARTRALQSFTIRRVISQVVAALAPLPVCSCLSRRLRHRRTVNKRLTEDEARHIAALAIAALPARSCPIDGEAIAGRILLPKDASWLVISRANFWHFQMVAMTIRSMPWCNSSIGTRRTNLTSTQLCVHQSCLVVFANHRSRRTGDPTCNITKSPPIPQAKLVIDTLDTKFPGFGEDRRIGGLARP
jgi:hypothetical protein